jgi:ADP-ribose pyrophosphatase YjhB (NUDIX family)
LARANLTGARRYPLFIFGVVTSLANGNKNTVDRSLKLDSDKAMTIATQMINSTSSMPLEQVGVLPVERGADGSWRVVLITTRDSGRWSIPKGNPMKGFSKAEAASIEAYEEGGLVGKASRKPIGSYQFWKRKQGHWELAEVIVYLLKVESRLTDFKEKGLRLVESFAFDDAEEAIMEPGLKSLIRSVGEKLSPEAG